MKQIRKTITALPSGNHSINFVKSSAEEQIYTNFVVTGTQTLTGNFNINPSGTPSIYTVVDILWNASITPSGHNVVIFGITIPNSLLASGNFKVQCFYDALSGKGAGGSITNGWVVNIIADASSSGDVDSTRLAADSVTTAKIADDAVTLDKVDAPGVGKIIYGDGFGNPKYLTIQDAKFIIGDTVLGATAQTISGDATVTKTGALTIAAGVIEGDAAASAGDRNIAAATIEPSNLTAGARKDSFSIRLDFDDASKLGGQIFLPVCYNCTVDAVKATLVGAAGSDLTVIIKNAGGTVMTGSQIDVLSATVVGNVITSTVTGNNTMTGGTNMILEPSAAGTLAGHLHLTFCVTRDN
jgi:hypothetical protein